MMSASARTVKGLPLAMPVRFPTSCDAARFSAGKLRRMQVLPGVQRETRRSIPPVKFIGTRSGNANLLIVTGKIFGKTAGEPERAKQKNACGIVDVI